MKSLILSSVILLGANQLAPPQLDPKEGLAQLARQLESTDADERQVAAEAIATLGEAATPAIPALVCAIYSEYAASGWNINTGFWVPDAADRALAAIGRPSIPALVKLLSTEPYGYVGHRWGGRPCNEVGRRLESEGDWDVWVMVTNDVSKTLVKIGAPAVEELTRALETDPPGREWVASALAGFGPRAAPAVDALVHALDLAPPESSRDFIEALAAIGPAAARATPLVVRVLGQLPEPGARLERARLISALGEFGPGAKAAAPLLKRLAAQAAYAEQAQEALWKIEPAPQERLLIAVKQWRQERTLQRRAEVCQAFWETSARGLAVDRLTELFGPPTLMSDTDAYFGDKAWSFRFRRQLSGLYRIPTRDCTHW